MSLLLDELLLSWFQIFKCLGRLIVIKGLCFFVIVINIIQNEVVFTFIELGSYFLDFSFSLQNLVWIIRVHILVNLKYQIIHNGCVIFIQNRRAPILISQDEVWILALFESVQLYWIVIESELVPGCYISRIIETVLRAHHCCVCCIYLDFKEISFV